MPHKFVQKDGSTLFWHEFKQTEKYKYHTRKTILSNSKKTRKQDWKKATYHTNDLFVTEDWFGKSSAFVRRRARRNGNQNVIASAKVKQRRRSLSLHAVGATDSHISLAAENFLRHVDWDLRQCIRNQGFVGVKLKLQQLESTSFRVHEEKGYLQHIRLLGFLCAVTAQECLLDFSLLLCSSIFGDDCIIFVLSNSPFAGFALFIFSLRQLSKKRLFGGLGEGRAIVFIDRRRHALT